MTEPDKLIVATASALADALVKRGYPVSEHMPGDERIEYYETMAEEVLDAIGGDMIPQYVALYEQRQARVLAKLAHIVAVIDKCRESAEMRPSPDGPSGDVTNLLHRGDLAERQLGYAQESVAEWSAAAAGHVETIESLMVELTDLRARLKQVRSTLK